ncbi:MAG: YggS family pyridoxal phosphate-dependent enzyme, partial [Actinomycetota bacterium]
MPEPTGPADLADDIASRLAHARACIADACARVGRDPAGVTLVGATKSVPPERIAVALAAGLGDVGEN